MYLSKNNIIIKLKSGDEYSILNPITGSFDLMDESEYRQIQAIENGLPADEDFAEYLRQRGYAYLGREDEARARQDALDEFRHETENTQVQLMLIPTYGCNLACTYCYQHGVEAERVVISKDAVDAFFNYVHDHFSNHLKKPFITLFGGEPLINSPAQREIITYIVEKAAAGDFEIAAVTNGYDFPQYVDILKMAKIKEIQFTLDGSQAVHDKRRATANGQGTFDKVIAGIAAAVDNNIPVNLRTVVDLENIGDLVNLTEYLDAKGWLDLPPELFKTQLGRNYELFECYYKPEHLMTQAGLWAEYSAMSRQFPILKKLHRPDFYGIRHIVDTGEMYMASFDTCPAAKTEWVFDLNGEIYGCTASCGRHEYLLGTFYPEVTLNDTSISRWQKRDVTAIDKCKECKYDVICGGGCGIVAANKNGGDPLTPDCRPVGEMLETGINHYADDLRAMSAEDITTDETDTADTHKKTEGCMICGAPLNYSTIPQTARCLQCGEDFETYAICENGHYVCDACHKSDILTLVEDMLDASDEKDPIKLLNEIFEIPVLNMHGPEYHSIVPAVLVTAYQNAKGFRHREDISEAIRRGRDIKGGACGIYGSCGAAIGTGIAVSIIQNATPMSNAARGNAQATVADAMMRLSKFGGPRCCKREAITSAQAFIEATGYFDALEPSGYVCRQYIKNQDCIGKKCPYFPRSKTAIKG